jgi:hypothetical protein
VRIRCRAAAFPKMFLQAEVGTAPAAEEENAAQMLFLSCSPSERQIEVSSCYNVMPSPRAVAPPPCLLCFWLLAFGLLAFGFWLFDVGGFGRGKGLLKGKEFLKGKGLLKGENKLLKGKCWREDC